MSKVLVTKHWLEKHLEKFVFDAIAFIRFDLVDLDLDVDLGDVDLAVSLCDGPRSVLFSFGLVAPTCFISFWPRREMVFRDLVWEFLQYDFPAVFPASWYLARYYFQIVPIARIVQLAGH